MQKLKQQRNLYLEEINNYEIYLINKELGLIEINEGKEIINVEENKNKNKSNSKEISIFDNHNKVYEKQSLFLDCKEDLKNVLKVYLTNLNSGRKLLYNSIHFNISDLVNYIYTELTNLNEFFKEEIKLVNKNYNDNNICNYIDVDNLVNQLIEDDFYTFKFVLRNKNNKKKIIIIKLKIIQKLKKRKRIKKK